MVTSACSWTCFVYSTFHCCRGDKASPALRTVEMPTMQWFFTDKGCLNCAWKINLWAFDRTLLEVNLLRTKWQVETTTHVIFHSRITCRSGDCDMWSSVLRTVSQLVQWHPNDWDTLTGTTSTYVRCTALKSVYSWTQVLKKHIKRRDSNSPVSRLHYQNDFLRLCTFG